MNKVYQIVTDQIIEMLEKVDTKDFSKPWFDMGIAPHNAVTKHQYQGINRLLLPSGGYATFKQWASKDCTVKKGEKGSLVVFWKMLEKGDGDEKETIPMLRYYKVFHSSQVEGDFARQFEDSIKPKTNDHERLGHAEDLVRGYIKQNFIKTKMGDCACYSPTFDTIEMPDLQQFKTPEHYYATYLHEMVHSTGHEKRLKRDLKNKFGSVEYAKEELIAELGAAFLCGDLGLVNMPREDHAAYLKSWLKALKDDPRFIISASSKAQKACDRIHEDAQAWSEYEDRAQLLAAE